MAHYLIDAAGKKQHLVAVIAKQLLTNKDEQVEAVAWSVASVISLLVDKELITIDDALVLCSNGAFERVVKGK